MDRKRQVRLVGLGVVLCLLAWLGNGQQNQKKEHAFRGKVEEVNASTKSLTVKHEKVEGWMEAMTMDYKVDDASVLKSVKPGDQIMATVYDGDMVLHKVHVMPKQGGSKKM